MLLIIYSLTLGAFIALKFSLWLFYRILLIFLGGIIIVIIYICTLGKNEKVTQESHLWGLRVVLIFSSIIFSFKAETSFINEAFDFKFLRGLYKSLSINLLYFLIVYLLIRLFFIVKLTESFKGALLKFK